MKRDPVNLIKDPPGEALLRFSLLFLNYKAKKYGRMIPPPEDLPI